VGLNLNIQNICSTTIVLLLAFLSVSCSTLQAGFYILLLDYDGKGLLKKEPDVTLFLEEILESPDKYTMYAYTRRALASYIKSSALRIHSFYVIKRLMGMGDYYTLSFSATGKTFYSEGAWAIDTESDIDSYERYLNGKNEWEVWEIETINGINTAKTIYNILGKINSNISYYYKDHISDEPGKDSCITALHETLVENE
jgi:hypothetical protein